MAGYLGVAVNAMQPRIIHSDCETSCGAKVNFSKPK